LTIFWWANGIFCGGQSSFLVGFAHQLPTFSKKTIKKHTGIPEDNKKF